MAMQSKDRKLRLGPLYLQISEVLKERIKMGIYGVEEAIPTENEIMEEFKVSRATIRSAIDGLVNIGLLKKEQGRGTFVCQKILEEEIGKITSFSEDFKSKGFKVSTKWCEKKIMKNAPMHVLEKLQLEKGAVVVKFKRIRLVNNRPISLSTTYIPQSLVPGILDGIENNESLYNLLEEKYGLDLFIANQKIKATLPHNEEAKLLEMDEKKPVLRMTRVTHSSLGYVIEFGEIIYKGDEYIFEVVLKGRPKRI